MEDERFLILIWLFLNTVGDPLQCSITKVVISTFYIIAITEIEAIV